MAPLVMPSWPNRSAICKFMIQVQTVAKVLPSRICAHHSLPEFCSRATDQGQSSCTCIANGKVASTCIAIDSPLPATPGRDRSYGISCVTWLSEWSEA